MKTPEGYEKDEICKYLRSIGAWYCRPYMAGYGGSGVPDIIACVNGIFLGIEVKREGKEPTPLQMDTILRIEKASGVALWGTAKKVICEIEKILDCDVLSR